VRLEGNWDLLLTGPSLSQTATSLRLEEFENSYLTIQGQEVLVWGTRSTSETRIEVALPADWTELSQPYLVVEAQRLAAYSRKHTADGLSASFPPTPFGSRVTFEMGSVAVPTSTDSLTLTIAMGQALRRAEGGPNAHGKFAIDQGDVVAGNPDIVISGERGTSTSRGGGEWVGVQIKGNWDPEGPKPKAYDQSGRELQLDSRDNGYHKDLTGNILPGETTVRFLLEDPSDLEFLTLVMGPPSSIDRQDHTVVLRPK
jgi:hypothetical protein